MAEEKRQLCLRGKVIYTPGRGELHPPHGGPLDRPFFAQLAAVPPSLLGSTTALWDGFPSLLLFPFCAWLCAPVASPRPARAFLGQVSPAVTVKA